MQHSAIIMKKSLEQFTRFIWWNQKSTKQRCCFSDQTNLGHKSTCRRLSPTSTTAIYYYFARKPTLILPSHEG